MQGSFADEWLPTRHPPISAPIQKGESLEMLSDPRNMVSKPQEWQVMTTFHGILQRADLSQL